MKYRERCCGDKLFGACCHLHCVTSTSGFLKLLYFHTLRGWIVEHVNFTVKGLLTNKKYCQNMNFFGVFIMTQSYFINLRSKRAILDLNVR